MTKTITYSTVTLLAFALLFSATAAYAEDETDTTTNDSGTEVSDERTKPRPLPGVRAIRADNATATPAVRDRAATTTVRDALQNVRDRVQTFSSTTAERREALREQGIDNASDRIIANLKRFVAVIEAAADRLTTIIERIESRMAKLAEAGVDTSTAQTHLDNAKESLRAVYVKIGDIKGEVDAATSDTARETLENIRELLREAKDDLKNASQSIRQAVQALKDAAGDVRDTSTDNSTDEE